MELLPPEIERQLLDNGKNREADHWPVVKIFNPTGAGTWLLTELDEDRDTLFGLCDLGAGQPELGYVSLSELREFRGGFGLPLERDLYFRPSMPLSKYADEARAAGYISA